MKVGDIVKYRYPPTATRSDLLKPFFEPVGTVIEFMQATHAKEFQKVKVLTENGMEDWIVQFCKVVSTLD